MLTRNQNLESFYQKHASQCIIDFKKGTGLHINISYRGKHDDQVSFQEWMLLKTCDKNTVLERKNSLEKYYSVLTV